MYDEEEGSCPKDDPAEKGYAVLTLDVSIADNDDEVFGDVASEEGQLYCSAKACVSLNGYAACLGFVRGFVRLS